ncbi:MAG: molecular chaperone TorD family protein [Chloroflexi bacterium]|nr:molecular chaperone TorD family protein [Chloroflexota bacterium]
MDGAGTSLSEFPINSSIETVILQQTLFRFFAWLFLYPDQHLLEVLRNGSTELLQMEFLWKDKQFAGSIRSLLKQLLSLDETGVSKLVQEYNRLFLIKPLVPPYESLTLAPEGRGRGWVAAQLERQYNHFGLELSNSLNELPDHLAVELEFMSYLCGLEAAALETNELVEIANTQKAQRAFLDKHLRRWFPIFSQKVQKIEPKGEYAIIVKALGTFLET